MALQYNMIGKETETSNERPVTTQEEWTFFTFVYISLIINGFTFIVISKKF